ncbi:MAG: Rab family GTPase [Promethearchaeota archaeon]
MHRDVVFKVIVVGDPEVGKTSLIKKFTRERFEEDYIPTVGVNIAKHPVKFETSTGNELEINLMFWDIAGQRQFYMLHKIYYQGAAGIIFVYDITRAQTFTNIKEWHKSCIKYGLSGVPAILVGNKNDLSKDRKIIPPMAENLAKQLDMPYYETSALTGDKVNLIFQDITKLMAESKNLQ